MNRKSRETWALYCRSYLLTVGLLLMAGSLFSLYLVHNGPIVWPWWGFALAIAVAGCGAALFGVGLFGSHSRLDKWADAASTHEASIFLMAISYPTYLILKQFYHRR